MARIRINPYGVSESVTLLSREIAEVQNEAGLTNTHLCLRLSSDLSQSQFRGRVGDLIINWGSGREIPDHIVGRGRLLNTPASVNTAANKLNAFRAFLENDVKTVDCTPDRDVAQEWVDDGYHVFCRTELRGHSGEGIIVVSNEEPEALGNVEWSTELPQAPLYTKGISSQHREYRVHVFCGKVIFVQQKRRANGWRENENYSNVVRNHGNGWVYGHEEITAPIQAVIDQAKLAVSALGLDFGAVDVLSRQDEAWVLEVNTAPGLSGDTNRRNYANAILSVVNGEEVQGLSEYSNEPVVETIETVNEETQPNEGNEMNNQTPIQVGSRVGLTPESSRRLRRDPDLAGTVTRVAPIGIYVRWDGSNQHIRYQETSLTLIQGVVRDSLGRLPVGTVVTMSAHGRTNLRNHSRNPHGIEGTINGFVQEGTFSPNSFIYRVMWSNGQTNSYRDVDLEPSSGQVEQAPTPADWSNFFSQAASETVSLQATEAPSAVAQDSQSPQQPQTTNEVIEEVSAPTERALVNGSYYVLEKNGERFVGEFCEDNNGFWDTRLEMNYVTQVTVVREINVSE